MALRWTIELEIFNRSTLQVAFRIFHW